MTRRNPQGWLLPAAIASSLFLAACGGERQAPADDDQAATIKVNTPAQIAQESAENYDDNVNGLITGKTLKRWKDNWEKERPAGITGKLVIFQQAQGVAGKRYIKPDNSNVFTYLESEWRESRSNGVIEVEGIVLSGAKVDQLLRRYAIDPRKDLILCAQGVGGGGNAMNLGRCWYTFRYWGVDSKHLAILDGGNDYLSGPWTTTDFADTASPVINRSLASVKDLPADNTALQATFVDLINVLPVVDQNVKGDGVFLWDGRSRDQFSAGETSEAGTPLADYTRSFQNGGSRQGHPRGGLQLNWTNLMINGGTGGLFKPKAELRAYIEGGTDAAGKGFVDGSYQLLGPGNAYQPGDVVYLWCETAARAAVANLVSAVILGLPTRLYDGSMIEWNSLTATVDKDGGTLLPDDSPWRTDELSFYKLNQPGNIASRSSDSVLPRIRDAYAASADAIIKADKAYKQAPSDGNSGGNNGGNNGGDNGGSNGGGVVLPPNPCGG
jgi:3-mercaptopyruvate sulfurtransferase SseA